MKGHSGNEVSRASLLVPLLEDVDALARRGAMAIRGELPVYADQDLAFLEEVTNQVRSNYSALLCTLLEGRALTAEDLAFQRSVSMRRARSGFPLEAYLAAYRVGQQVLWDAIIAAADSSAAGQGTVLGLVSDLMRLIDFATTHAAQAYVDFRQYGLVDAARLRRDLLERLLGGEFPAHGPLLAAAERYGLRADGLAVVAVGIDLLSQSSDGCELAAAALSRVEGEGGSAAGALVVVRQSELVGIYPLPGSGDPEPVVARLIQVHDGLRGEGVPLAIGVSTVAEGAAGLPDAYREATTALRLVGRGRGVSALTRLSPFEYLALSVDRTAMRLIDPRVRDFLQGDRARGGVLTASIRAYAEADLSLKNAAARLHVHPHTAQYRLRRVQELTGLNPRGFVHLQELMVAMAIADADADADAADIAAPVASS